MRSRLRLFALVLLVCGAVRAQAPAVQDLAKGRFLIAAKGLLDPNFRETVVLLLDYDAAGAMGLIVNRETRLPLTEILPELEIAGGRSDVIFVGGPVQPDGLIVLIWSETPPEEARQVLGDVHMTGSRDQLMRLAGEPESRFRAYAGYAGWAPGQLDSEVARGDWLIAPATAAAVFDRAPERLWRRLIDRSRVRIARIAPNCHHPSGSVKLEWRGRWTTCAATAVLPTSRRMLSFVRDAAVR